MASDVVDYEESRSGRRLDGLVFHLSVQSEDWPRRWRRGGGLDSGLRELYSASSGVRNRLSASNHHQNPVLRGAGGALYRHVHTMLSTLKLTGCPGGGHQPAVTSTSRGAGRGVLPPLRDIPLSRRHMPR